MIKKISLRYKKIVEDVKENSELLFTILAKCVSTINLIVICVLAWQKLGLKFNFSTFAHYSEFVNLVLKKLFNKIYIILFLVLLFLFLLKILIAYFKSDEKKLILNILLIITLLFIIVDIVLLLAITVPSIKVVGSIARVLTLNLEGDMQFLFIAAYFIIPIVIISLFIDRFRGKKSRKAFLSCIIFGTLGISFMVSLSGIILIFLIIGIVYFIISCIQLIYFLLFLKK